MRGGIPTPWRSSSPTMGRVSRPTSSNGSANPICRDGRTPKKLRVKLWATIAASVSGSSSPAPCLSGPVRKSPLPTGFFRITVRWYRSPGRAAASKPPKHQLNLQFRHPLIPGLQSRGAINLGRPWQRRFATPYVECLPKRTVDRERHRGTYQPHRPLTADRGGRQAVSGAAVARHGDPRLHGDILRYCQRWLGPNRQGGARLADLGQAI